MFHRSRLFIQDFQDPTIKSVHDLITDEKLDFAADGVTDAVGPCPRGTYKTLSFGWIVITIDCFRLWCENIREIYDEGRPCDEFALDGKCTYGGEAEVGFVVKLYATPLGGPTGAAAHDGFVELDGGVRRIQAFTVLKAAGHDLEHGGWRGGHLWFPTWLMGLDRQESFKI